MPPGRSSRTHDAQRRAADRCRCSSTSKSDTASKLAGCEAAVVERDGAQVEAAGLPELDRRRIQVGADRLPSGLARRFDDEARCCSRRRGTAGAFASRCARHQADALAAEALDAVVVALDARGRGRCPGTPATRTPRGSAPRRTSGSRRRDRTSRQRTSCMWSLSSSCAGVRRAAGRTARAASAGPRGMRPCTRTSSSIGCVRFSISCL